MSHGIRREKPIAGTDQQVRRSDCHLLLCFALICYFLRRFCDRILITKIVVLRRLEAVVELVDEQNSCRNMTVTISSSETSSSSLTAPCRESPCAAMTWLRSDRIEGGDRSCQSGRKRSTVSFRHSVAGSSLSLRSAYREYLCPGNLDAFFSSAAA